MNLEKEDVGANCILRKGTGLLMSQDIFLGSIDSCSLLTAIYFLCDITVLFYMILNKL